MQESIVISVLAMVVGILIHTFNMLDLGDRVWLNILSMRYVGIAEVIGNISRAESYQFSEFENITLNEIATEGIYSSITDLDDDNAE